MSESAPPPDAPAPVAPGIGELFERALQGLVMGRSAFAPLAERPAPSYGTMTVLALGFAVAGMTLSAALTAVSDPAKLGSYPLWFYAAVTAAAVGISLAWLLLSSAVLFGLGKALGGDGGFEHGYLAAAMLFALAPVQALASLFPLAWVAPSVLFAWAGAGALSGLLRANFTGALAACAMLAGLSLAGQAVARAAYAKSQEVATQAQAMLSAGETAGQAAVLMQALQQAQAQAQTSPPPGAGAPAASSLDMLRPPEEAGAPEAPPDAQAALLKQGDALRVNAEGMIGSILPMLENPAVTKNLDAQGKADMKELRDLLADLKSKSAAGTIDSRYHTEMMQKIQALSMRVMMAGMRAPAAPAAPGKKK